MSKYIKLEDAIRKYAEMFADEAYWEHGVGDGKPDEEDLDIAREYYSDLPTIEVSKDTAIRIVENECFRDDLSQEIKDYLFSDLRHKLYHEQVEVSEDCISREQAIELLCRSRCGVRVRGCPVHSCPIIEKYDNLPSVAPSVVPKANKNEWVEEFSDDGWRWVKDEL